MNHPAGTDTDPELDALHAGLAEQRVVPLWTEIGDLMPSTPRPRAVAHRWSWPALLELAERSGHLVPVGRGGERRALALANPGLGGAPFATPTLWAAIQYLNPREDAPVHRHTQNAFRFVVEGEGVWTVVDDDPVAMRRGDLLFTPGRRFHGHHNRADVPMAWLDGLDIPLFHHLDAGFFEEGPDEVRDRSTPPRSRSERLWCHPGLTPVGAPAPGRCSPVGAYRWEHTDAALADQLALEAEGLRGVVEPGHAAVRFSDPGTGGDVLPTIRAEMHRLRPGARTATRREVGSSVWQVFEGDGSVQVGGRSWAVHRGDLVVVPSWAPYVVRATTGLDLFRFSDAPVLERLHADRVLVEDH
ncbi:Gentisate 1,2-dioxygenase [Pseudonocardia sp. Ae168_Ps1]|uniref:cupin domain-containing protein n=1 Tax=unclassified Pseudonocardia TaxID=2619320 RepID=UPI00094ABF75|nr:MULTISPECIES: cupin domain-containing protein [unclassified Pseudonocardia]OLL74670.1 Gentisate 1,2-dioxygenase [Pseudonocardia sp. Ae150A_Ps1]OLL80650.1 Gentisate 1,2-dioxygenase [Pseudonocardia sp. Ae168_Ps1]OLL85221.1 Gentisate 1,2-dioxygenase [Pseudonocardia sp. Ae263_Ps1]OLL94754.1 Gentisate 1,2-dioxygenase [Pseudonocardia sp. Ae356_Ps1]